MELLFQGMPYTINAAISISKVMMLLRWHVQMLLPSLISMYSLTLLNLKHLGHHFQHSFGLLHFQINECETSAENGHKTATLDYRILYEQVSDLRF
jgi:hypothetical protein